MKLDTVALLPSYQRVPACQHAIDGSCCGGNCPCPAHCPPEGRRGEGLPPEEIDAFWDRRALACRPAWTAL